VAGRQWRGGSDGETVTGRQWQGGSDSSREGVAGRQWRGGLYLKYKVKIKKCVLRINKKWNREKHPL